MTINKIEIIDDVVKMFLTQDKFTIMDLEDYGAIKDYHWYAKREGRGLYYAARCVHKDGKFKTVKMHRQIMSFPSDLIVDHINRDPLDNRRSNLRVCTRSENGQNRRPTTGKTSIYQGVCFDSLSKKWHSQIKVDGKARCVGYFVDEQDAAKAYDRMAIKLFGEYARTNIMVGGEHDA